MTSPTNKLQREKLIDQSDSFTLQKQRPSQNIARPSLCLSEKNNNHPDSKTKLKKLVMFTFTFMIVELLGGYFSNSVAIVSDGLHMGADTIGYTVQLFSVYLSLWQPNNIYTFGYKRGEVLGGMFNCVLIWSLTIFLIYEAIHRMIYPPEFFNSRVMLFTAVLGVLLNLTMGGILVGFENIGRIAKFWEDDSDAENPDSKDYNLRITIMHIRGDMGYSVGVFISAVLINLFPKWLIIDSLCTIIFSYVVVHITQPIVFSVTRLIFEAVPESGLIRCGHRKDKEGICLY